MNHTERPTCLIQRIDGHFVRTDFDEKTDIIAAMELRGFKYTGPNRKRSIRSEILGAPTFLGAAGPMWDRGTIRYEDRAAEKALSV